MERIPREAVIMKKHHQVESVNVENGILCLLVDGNRIESDLKNLSPLLANAKEEELSEFEISPSGYGIHWPLLDEDISIDSLLGIVHSPNNDRKSA
jgi:hypothetical protein